MAKTNSSYIELLARKVLMRVVVPVVFLLVELIHYFPGDPSNGWKHLLITVCVKVCQPLWRLNSWMYQREVAARRELAQ